MATEPSSAGSKHDFPAVSEESPSTPGGGERSSEMVETVYQWKGPEKYGKGEKIGSVTVRSNGARFTADFTFDDRDIVTLDGAIPGNGSWKGKGKATYVRGKGTGKFANRTGDIEIESDNPKRWG
jgi:hypothetical protein